MSDIDNAIEELNYIIDKWQICEFCKIVDDDRNRTKYGHICSACGKESNGGQMYFDMSVHVMIDLIKEAFTTDHKIEHKGTKLEYQLNTHYISVLLFFCTLRETLLNGLITDLCSAHKVPKNIYLRLISDNKLHIQKQDKLFKSLTGEKWFKSLEILKAENTHDFIALNEKIRDLVKLRNSFAHKGAIWDINRDTAIDCIKSISPLIELYVALNNKYVHSKYE